MARIRTIKPGFFRHADLYDAEVESALPLRVAFAGLWCCADREGRFRWQPRELKLDVLPHDLLDFSRVLDALMTRGFIVRYETPDGVFGFIPSWSRHQVINNREVASVLPSPPPPSKKSQHKQPTADASSTRKARVEHADMETLKSAQGEYGRGTGTGTGREGEEEQSSLRSDTPQAADLALDETDPPASKPLRKPKPQPPAFPDWFPLVEWGHFVEMRKKIRAPLTAGAVALNVKTLIRLRTEGHDPAAVLNQSIANSYRGLFALKSDQGNGSRPHGKANGPTTADRAIRALADAAGVDLGRPGEPDDEAIVAHDDAPRFALVGPAGARQDPAGRDTGADRRAAGDADPALLATGPQRRADAFEIPRFLLRS